MTTKFKARTPKGNGIRANRLAVVIGGAVMALAAAAILVSPAVTAQQAGRLDGQQINEMYNPGVVMIVAIYNSTLSGQHPAIPDASVAALRAFADQQVKSGIISSSVSDVLRAEIQEISNNPNEYLKPGNDAFSTDMQVTSSGSGFILTPDGYMVTNAHVVATADSEVQGMLVDGVLQKLIPADLQTLQDTLKSVQLSSEEQTMYQSAVKAYYLANMKMTSWNPPQVTAQIGIAIPGLSTLTKAVPADVKQVGVITPGKDVAVLKIEQTNLPTVPVGDDTKLQVGDKIFIIGYPAAADMGVAAAGSEASMTSGEVSARQTMPGGWQAIQTDAAINHGNSGGPAFNDQGQVIGLATFGATNAQNVNFLVPMSVVNEFLNGQNIKPQQSDLSTQWIAAINDLEANDCSKAQHEFEQIKNLNPGFPYVQDKITAAANPSICKEPWYDETEYQIGAGAVIVILLAIGVLAMIKKKPAQSMAGASAAGGAVAMQGGVSQQGLPAGGGAYGAPGAAGYVAPAGPPRSYGSLQCTSGAAAGKRFEITKQGLLIGRDSAKCQIVLPEDAVSKEHAWVVPVDEGVVLIDRGSTNGVFLNSLDSPKVSKVTLHHGDKIYIGKGAASFTYMSS
ncbi:MAG: trypsin-like peptidase domain-containing protein [Candidatus Acidiferrales bacterium]